MYPKVALETGSIMHARGVSMVPARWASILPPAEQLPGLPAVFAGSLPVECGVASQDPSHPD